MKVKLLSKAKGSYRELTEKAKGKVRAESTTVSSFWKSDPSAAYEIFNGGLELLQFNLINDAL